MAAHHRNNNVVISTLFILIISHSFVLSMSQSSDAQVLKKFKQSLQNATALSSWDKTASPCNGDKELWSGVNCEKGIVWGIQIENMGIKGVIDVDTLVELRGLRALSFMNNNFEGSIPNFSKLGALKTIYLSNNKFSGSIPESTFNNMLSLKKLYLANNKFSGPIPVSLTALPKLMELQLENNHFEGNLPVFGKDHKLSQFDVSNNALVGPIPSSLSYMDASSFSGNSDLCGAPLAACTTTTPTPTTPTSTPTPTKKLPTATIIIVAIVVAAALLALVAVFVILSRRRKQTPNQQPRSTPAGPTAADMDRMEQGHHQPALGSSSPDHGNKKAENVKLTFLRDDRQQFDMTDLLKSSAEILGSGVFGSTYKAALTGGQAMAVKRYKHMNNVSKEEFNEHMRRLGRLNHPNVLPIVAFYYRKEEKLMVTDFVENGSLAVHLHGNKSRGLPPPNWPTRLNIVKGVAKGLKYLYAELPSITAPHGHLKSSNVLLDKTFTPLLTDYALTPVVNQEQAQEHMIAYKSPEYKHTNRITKKTDVWSFGILILEVLTGRFPSNFLQQGKGSDTDITTWVESVMRDESNVEEVFDGDMQGTKHCEGEMMKLLKIGLNCCQADVEKRPDIKEVIEKIEEIKEKDIDDEFYSTVSDGDVRSSRGLSDDFGGHVTFK